MAWSVPDAEAQLVIALQARTDLDDALVQEGLPAEVPTQLERVYLLGTEDAERNYTGTQQRQTESYTIPVLIEVRGYGADSRAATKDRAWAIVEELEAALAADRSLDANVNTAETGKAVAPAPRPTEDGWLMHITIDVHCVSLLG